MICHYRTHIIRDGLDHISKCQLMYSFFILVKKDQEKTIAFRQKKGTFFYKGYQKRQKKEHTHNANYHRMSKNLYDIQVVKKIRKLQH